MTFLLGWYLVWVFFSFAMELLCPLSCSVWKFMGGEIIWWRSFQSVFLPLLKDSCSCSFFSAFQGVTGMDRALPRGGWRVERLSVRIKALSSPADTVVGACYGPPAQEEEADETFHSQPEAASQSQALFLMGDFNHWVICWRDHTTRISSPEGSCRALVIDFWYRLSRSQQGEVCCWTLY